MKYFYILLFCFVSNKMLSQDTFTYVFDDVEGNKLSVKLESINDSSRGFWLKTERPAKKYKNKKGKLVTSPSNSTKQFIEIDCETNMYNLLDYTAYDANGRVTDSGNHFVYDKRITPESVMDGLKGIVCEIE